MPAVLLEISEGGGLQKVPIAGAEVESESGNRVGAFPWAIFERKKSEDSNVLYRFVVRRILGCFLWCKPIPYFSDTKWMGFQQFNSDTLYLELTLDPPS